MFSFEMFDKIRLLVLTMCSYKWIFFFVFFCAMELFMYAFDKRELKNDILYHNCFAGKVRTTEKDANFKEKLLAKTLSTKNLTPQESQLQVNNSEKALNNIESASDDAICNRYKGLLTDLKKDLKRTENEVQTLQIEVDKLSRRRQSLKNDLLSQQTTYENMLDVFCIKLKEEKKFAVSHTTGHNLK